MYHGHKEDIAGYLPSILKIAEDGQAIYEFLQNAVDCDSSECHIFYDDDYFLAINNGKAFSIDEVVSLLNIAQSPKKDADKIGRFGVGFKLVHRLVGQGDGASELVNDYKGPVLFSWSKQEDLEDFLENKRLDYTDELQNEDLPFLFKILLTNFPADIGESVKDISFRDRMVFEPEELSYMQQFTQKAFAAVGNNNFKRGSAFFLQLGRGKTELLDKDYKDLVNGIQFSMNMLKNLTRVCINTKEIIRFPLQIERFRIERDSEAFARIKPEYTEFPINVSFGYPTDFTQSAHLKQSPNFYKYFPMGDETNGFSFIIHCDSFSNEVNRRKLQQDSVNKNLLPEITGMLIDCLNNYKQEKNNSFLTIYGNILLSDVPSKQNNDWLKPIFYDKLQEFLRTNIPIRGGYFRNDPQQVKIKDIKMEIDLSQVGLAKYDWFVWDAKNKDFTIHAQDKEKLGLEKWDIRDIVEEANIEELNIWISKLDELAYKSFLHELNTSELRITTEKRLAEIKLFKFSDGNFYSANQQAQHGSLIFNTEQKTLEIKDILEELGFITTCLNISSYGHIFEAIEKTCIPNENRLFDTLSTRCETHQLSTEQKKRLILNLTNPDFWTEIQNEKLSKLVIFSNRAGQIYPIGSLLSSAVPIPYWLENYQIAPNEYEKCIEKLLVEPSCIYTRIIIPNLDEILATVTDHSAFYRQLKQYYEEDENGVQLAEKKSIYIDSATGYVTASEVFFHPSLCDITHYNILQGAIFRLTELYIPDKKIVPELNDRPFSLQYKLLSEFDLDEEVMLNLDEIKVVLDLCSLSEDNFFEKYIITKKDLSFNIIPKTEGKYQIRVANAHRKFIEEHFSDVFYVLPAQLDQYKDRINGILEKEELYDKIILDFDIDNHQEELVKILSYENSIKKFLKKLDSLPLDISTEYASEDWEYKVLNWACQYLRFEEEISAFREKITISCADKTYSLTDIPPIVDTIEIGDKKLNLSQILPKSFNTVSYINEIASKFSPLGKTINKILGIKEQEDNDHYYTLLWNDELDVVSNNPDERIVLNTEQLVFILLYHLHEQEIDLSKVNIHTQDEEFVWSFDQAFSIVPYSFLEPQRILDSKQYQNLGQYREILLTFEDDNLQFLEGPLDDSNTILCNMIKDDLNDQQRSDLIEYLYSRSQSKKATYNIEWSDSTKEELILGFNPATKISVPSEYLITAEKLPEYLSKWLGNDLEKQSFLSVLGIASAQSPGVRLRQTLHGKGDFNVNEIASIHSQILRNTLAWLYANKISIVEDDKKRLLDKILEKLATELTIQNQYETDKLLDESEELTGEGYEKWSAETSYRIFLHDGPMTAKISVAEFDEYIFYEKQVNASLLDNQYLLVDKSGDAFEALSQLLRDNGIQTTSEELAKIYFNSIKKHIFSVNKDEEDLLNDIRRFPEDERETCIRNIRNSIRSPKDISDIQKNLKRYDINDGALAEQKVYDELVAKFGAERVKWTSSNNPLNSGNTTDEYDYEVRDKNITAVKYLIDCKSTTAKKHSNSNDIYWTESEWKFLEAENPDNYVVARVFDCNSKNHEITYLHISCIDLDSEEE